MIADHESLIEMAERARRILRKDHGKFWAACLDLSNLSEGPDPSEFDTVQEFISACEDDSGASPLLAIPIQDLSQLSTFAGSAEIPFSPTYVQLLTEHGATWAIFIATFEHHNDSALVVAHSGAWNLPFETPLKPFQVNRNPTLRKLATPPTTVAEASTHLLRDSTKQGPSWLPQNTIPGWTFCESV